MGFFYSSVIQLRRFSSKTSKIAMRYLNVAEKNDAAKNIASILSRGASNRREGLSPYNKIYEFNTTVLGQSAQMIMTSVSGHLLNYEFEPTYRSWSSCNPAALFDCPVVKICPENYVKIKRTLEREIRTCQGLIIWTDCDREGENIGFEIIKVCTDVKPDLRVFRAKFSEITAAAIFRALNTLGQPNKNVSDAVDVRQELDLRTGAAFTRLQTLRLQKVFPQKLADKLISYGSCQFPTLGFVVDRYQAIEDFVPEKFWRIKMNHKMKEITTEFNWKRERLFDKNACEAILDICKESPIATVEAVDSKPKSKWRPLPLDTVEMEKTVSKKLKITAKETMKIAEKLYTQGFISYPRTETNIFPKELNLTNLVEQQRNDQNWGIYAQRILNRNEGPNPRQGRKTDQAHPPIHPTKYTNSLTGNDARIYEYIVRHFLACVDKDAQGYETVINVTLANEKFYAKGLIVLEKNYLDIYIYEKWNEKEIYNYNVGEQFQPTVLDIIESKTSPPKLLTEADLIALMDKNGIGTDATHAEHIDTIKSREYVGLHENIYFVPGTLGMGLVEGYNNIGLEVSLAKPNLRSEFENDLKLICEGLKSAETVRQEQILKYRNVFQIVTEKILQIDESLGNRLNDQPQNYIETQIEQQIEIKTIFKCPKCNNNMVLRNRKNSPGQYISCVGYPTCNNTLWLPQSIDNVTVLDETCPNCGPNVKLLKIKFKINLFPGDPNPNTLCIGGCDTNVLETLNITLAQVMDTQRRNNGNNRPNHEHYRQQNDTLRPQNDSYRPQNDSNRTQNDSSRPQNDTYRPQNDSSRRNPLNEPRNGNGNEIVCSCNVSAVLLTVKKDGLNKGRKFYKCPNSVCDFFLWAPTDDAPNLNNTSNNTEETELKCNCNMAVVQRTVQKNGPNIGRKFWCCSKPMGQNCSFFKWIDDGGGSGSGNQGESSGAPPLFNNWKSKSGNNSKSNRAAPYNTTKTKRKCGNCGQEGHIRTKCPNN